jgi:hypothetical protein
MSEPIRIDGREIQPGESFTVHGATFTYTGVTELGGIKTPVLADQSGVFKEAVKPSPTSPAAEYVKVPRAAWDKLHDLALTVSLQEPGDEDGVGAWDDPQTVLDMAELILHPERQGASDN